ncbi:hypothetical protein KR018_009508 [Drosophila ironensis]|nr:hypothetical protein KR018_009508 [Drosophila ironensis]
MQKQNIWNSPQVGGSGGALKALARNVANHLKLDRTTMKRVVAQVVAEHHSLGEVADYKGHMYFVKPDRLNFTELIAQSKEAFDDMLLHQPRLAKRIQLQQRGGTWPPPVPKSHSMSRLGPRDSRSRRHLYQAQLPAPGIKVFPPPLKPRFKPKKHASKKRKTFKKSSTTEFQLADSGIRSLNGFIIDANHLPQDGKQKEILLHVPPAAGKRSRRRGQPKQRLQGSQGDSPKAAEKPEPQQQGHQPLASNITIQASRPSKSHLMPKKTNSRRLQRQINACSQRLYAGYTPKPAVKRTPSVIQESKPPTKSRSMIPTSQRKKKMQLQRTYDKPWLVRRRRKRLSGGSQQKTKPQEEPEPPKEPTRLDKVFVEWEEKKSEVDKKSEGNKIGEKKLPPAKKKDSRPARKSRSKRKLLPAVARQIRNVPIPWYTRYHSPSAGGAGAGSGTAIATGSGHGIGHGNNTARQQASVLSMARKQNLTTRQRHHRRMQERLKRDLQREEAIDDPHSNDSGTFRHQRIWHQRSPSPRPSPRLSPRASMRHSPRPSARHLPRRLPATPSLTAAPRNKTSPERQPLKCASSHTKRFPHPNAVGERGAGMDQRLAGGGANRSIEEVVMGSGGPGVKSAGAKRLRGRTHARNNRTRGGAGPQGRRKIRSVRVDSSLGSIAGLGAGQPQDSKHSLTPAKRHLTIAFLNKRGERADRSRDRLPLQPWK